MNCSTPKELIETLVSARDRGDVDAVVALYQKDAAIVPQPGTVQVGHTALVGWLESFAALKPQFSVQRREIIEAGDVALHHAHWTLSGVDGSGAAFSLTGRTADVFRRQATGGWLLAIDNPWGTALLD